MKNLICLVSAFLLVIFCLTSCQKEELQSIEQPVAGKKIGNTAVISGGLNQICSTCAPLVLIANYTDDVYFDCCEYSQYTMNDLTHSYFIEDNNLQYKVTFVKDGATTVKYTTEKTFLKHWAIAGVHQVKVEIVNFSGSAAIATSPDYAFTNTSSPICIVC